MTVESKSAFSRRRNRSASAVGQWIKAGVISGAALEGEGRSARINVEIAEAQLAARLDPGQSLANGAITSKPTNQPFLKRTRASKKTPSSKSRSSSGEYDEHSDAKLTRGSYYAREKARLAKAQADAQEMKNQQVSRELVAIAEVEAKWSDIIVSARSRLLSVATRVRDALPHLTATDVLKIDAEIRKALTDLGRAKAL